MRGVEISTPDHEYCKNPIRCCISFAPKVSFFYRCVDAERGLLMRTVSFGGSDAWEGVELL